MKAAQLRRQGQARIKNRKGKRSCFKQRPDKTKTEKRKALSINKSDEIDLDHYPDEASNDADDEEAGDVDIEGEDAEGKYS